MVRSSSLALLAFALLTPGCLPDETTDMSPAQRGGERPAMDPTPALDLGAPEPVLSTDGAPEADAADAAPPEADASPWPPSGAACVWPSDCPVGDCVDGACLNDRPGRCPADDDAQCAPGEVCGGFHNRYYCFTPCELDESCALRPRPCLSHADCPFGQSCAGDRCINSCVTDLDCPTEGFCYEGECRRQPTDLLDGDAPAPVGEPGQIYAGVGAVPLDYPVGVSMAGYGGRPGPRTPYQTALGGSDRIHEHQDVRAIALGTEEDTLIVVRLPMSWSTDYMLTLTTQKLQALTVSPEHPKGINYAGKIITGGTHSHSQPGRFWNLVPATGFGVFGYGSFSPEMVNRYTDSFARAIKAALDDMRPARVGWRLLDSFDPDRRIHSDRRGESPEFVDDRMLVWRIEDAADGQPMAGLVNFAIHGTHMEMTWITGDAPGAIEVVLTEQLSARAGKPVPVLFINGNAGDISPRGDDGVVEPYAKIQAVGRRVWPIFEAAWDAIEPTAEVTLEVVSKRVAIDYERLGYDPSVPEFRGNDGRAQIYGAFKCVEPSLAPEDPPYEDGMLGCRLNIQAFLGAPVVQLHKTVFSAYRLNNLVVTTLPGEPTSPLGVHLSEQIEGDARAAGMTDVRVMNFGYSQDHHLYLLEPDDWFRGGYEASQNLWGWRLGSFIQAQSRSLAAQLFTDEKEDNSNDVKPTWWPTLEDDTVTPTDTLGAAGAISQEGPEALQRGDLFELRWEGGHPGVDQPEVWLERHTEAGFEPVMRPGGGLPFNHDGFETLTIYYGDYEADHQWGVRWELPFWLEVGTYRVHLSGTARQGGEDHPYEGTGRPFELSPATLAVRDATYADGRLAFKLNYPNGPSNDHGGALDALHAEGHWLRFDAGAQPGANRTYGLLLGPPLEEDVGVSVQAAGGEPVVADVVAPDQVSFPLVTARTAEGVETTAAINGWPATRVEAGLTLASGAHTLTVRDEHGNTGTLSLTVP